MTLVRYQAEVMSKPNIEGLVQVTEMNKQNVGCFPCWGIDWILLCYLGEWITEFLHPICRVFMVKRKAQFKEKIWKCKGDIILPRGNKMAESLWLEERRQHSQSCLLVLKTQAEDEVREKVIP